MKKSIYLASTLALTTALMACSPASSVTPEPAPGSLERLAQDVQTLSNLPGAVTAQSTVPPSPLVTYTAVINLSGVGASLGESEGKALKLLQTSLDKLSGFKNFPIKIEVLDDASVPPNSIALVQQGVASGSSAIICCTGSGATLAILPAVTSASIPTVSLAGTSAAVEPVAQRQFIFKVTPPDAITLKRTVDEMKAQGELTVGLFGPNDPSGESIAATFTGIAQAAGLSISGKQTFARNATDTSVQATALLQTNPDTIFVYSSTPNANVAQASLLTAGFNKQIFHYGAVVNNDFLKPGNEGVIVAGPPLVVAPELSGYKPTVLVAKGFANLYRQTYNEPAPAFAGYAWDAATLLISASAKAALGGVNPSNVTAFRAEIRNQLEKTVRFPGTIGTYNFSSTDHNGLGDDSVALLTVKNSTFVLFK